MYIYIYIYISHSIPKSLEFWSQKLPKWRPNAPKIDSGRDVGTQCGQRSCPKSSEDLFVDDLWPHWVPTFLHERPGGPTWATGRFYMSDRAVLHERPCGLACATGRSYVSDRPVLCERPGGPTWATGQSYMSDRARTKINSVMIRARKWNVNSGNIFLINITLCLPGPP